MVPYGPGEAPTLEVLRASVSPTSGYSQFGHSDPSWGRGLAVWESLVYGCFRKEGVLFVVGVSLVIRALPGPPKYVKEWPKTTISSQEGYYSTYFWGPGIIWGLYEGPLDSFKLPKKTSQDP